MTYAEYEKKEQLEREYPYRGLSVIDEDPPQVSGPMPGAIDREDACKSVGYKLDSWTRLITPTTYGYMHNAQPTPDSIPAYLYNLQEDAKREKIRASQGLWGYRADTDERPYFHDPSPLAFDPLEAIHRDDRHQHEGVSLAEIWADPLARTFWLAIKARHITSQYFRGECVAMAKWARNGPPRVAEDLSVSTGAAFMDLPSRYFRIQLFPYIVRQLMEERKWPYFHPSKACVAERALSWKVVTK